MGVRVIGVNQTIRYVENEIDKRHNNLVRTAKNVEEDLLRKAKDNVPLQTGMLADSGTGKVTVNGNTITIEVSFDTPYALRMHEDHYTARPRMSAEERRNLPIRRKGPTQDLSDDRPSGGGLLGKRGRKYLTRAWWNNRKRYNDDFQKAVK